MSVPPDRYRRYAHLDFDPVEVPIVPAATVLLLDDRPDLHVLMLRRTTRVVFAPDSWVFPGGRVDPQDHEADFDKVSHGLSDREASSMLGISKGGLAWWLAACRETLEEAGVLLVGGDVPADIDQLRYRVQENRASFIDELIRRDLRIDAAGIREVAQFITPIGSPRRFDARFFVARAPRDQQPVHDNGEIVAWEWVRPQDCLDGWAAGELTMMSPTIRMLRCLIPHPNTDSVLTLADRRLPAKRVRVRDSQGAYHVLLPGDAGYDRASPEVEFGSVRLWK